MAQEIHHYCSSAVFLSLIKNRELWLTSLSQSNDHLEGKWMLKHWCNLFEQSNDPKGRLKGRGAQFAVEMVLQQNVALGTCFSEDGDLLSQWRGYADDGSGFSVEFDQDDLAKMSESYNGGSNIALSKISYGGHEREQVNEVVRLLHDAFGEDAAKYEEGGNGVGSMSLQFTPEKHKRQHEAARRLFTVKNGSFSEENEWRLFLFDSVRNIDGVEFRESRGVLSPYLRFKIPANIIRGVTLGPTNRTTRLMVEEALRAYGIDCRVSRSEASYRVG